MDVVAGGPIADERTAYNPKGYFYLAKEEIAKEWGLHEDAVPHYKNAQRIVLEASSIPEPSYICSSFAVLVKH